MARSSVKAATESDVTPAADETLGFDDDTLRGQLKSYVHFLEHHSSHVHSWFDYYHVIIDY